jgi:hypothetical protein
VLSLSLSALTGGFGFAILKLAIFQIGLGGESFFEGGAWNSSVTAMIFDGSILSIAYLALLTLSLPIWPILKQIFFRNPWDAGLLGMGLTELVWAGLIAFHHGKAPFHMAHLPFILLIGAMVIANGLAGAVIWYVACGRGRGEQLN